MGIWKEVIIAVRSLFLFLDSVVFWAIGELYKFFLTISQSTIVKWEMFEKFGERVYGLLGLFMLFKISFSLITYVVNPDDIDKDGKGVSSILKNVIVSLVLVVVTPYIFQAAYELQLIILKDDIIGRILISSSDESASFSEDSMPYVGDKMSFRIFTAFFSPNPDIKELNIDACSDNLIQEETNSQFILNTGCQEAINTLVPKLGDEYAEAFKKTSVSQISTVYAFASAIDQEEYDKNQNTVFVFEYKMLFSTICGAFVAFMLLNYCFDVAVRSVKLAFLQLIAPVPIISYIDPKTGKDGIFKKWVKQCTSTFLSLFVKLLVIYFVIYLIDQVDGKIYNMVTGETVDNLFVSVFVIMGLLLFARQLPRLLEDLIPGLKLEGSMGLNNLKSGLGFLGAGAAGLIGGAATGGVLGALGGAASGLFRGGAGILTGKKPFDAMHNQANANMARFQRNLNGIGRMDVMGARLNNMLGIPGVSGAAEARTKRLEEDMKPLKAESDVYKQVTGYQSAMKDVAKKEFAKSSQYRSAQANLDALKNTSVNKNDFAIKDAKTGKIIGYQKAAYDKALSDHQTKIAEAYEKLADAEKNFIEKHINDAFANPTNPDYAEINGIKAQLDSVLAANSGLDGIAGQTVSNYDDLKNVANSSAAASSILQVEINNLQTQINNISNSDEVRRAKAASSMAGKR